MLTSFDTEKIKQEILKNPCFLMDPIMIQWINKYAKTFPSNSIFVELGTFMGGTTRQIAKANPNAIVHTIDINDTELWSKWNYNGLRNFFERVGLNVNEKFIDLLKIQDLHLEDMPNVVRHTGDSLSLDIDNISLLLIDSNHSNDHVLKELNYYWPKIKSGGILFADDLDSTDALSVFNDFLKPKNLKMHILLSRYGMVQKI